MAEDTPENTPDLTPTIDNSTTQNTIPDALAPTLDEPAAAPVASPSDEQIDPDAVGKQDELTALKQRADVMGIKYGGQIGLDKLKARVQEKMLDLNTNAADAALNEMDVPKESYLAPVRETKGQKRVRLRKSALELVRIRVTNMNPNKGNLKGEILCVGNSVIGSIKKFIPYNAEEGWHVPRILLTQLQNRVYMSHFEVKVGKQKIKRHKLVKEFAIEILPPLTAEEVKELANRQIITNI